MFWKMRGCRVTYVCLIPHQSAICRSSFKNFCYKVLKFYVSPEGHVFSKINHANIYLLCYYIYKLSNLHYEIDSRHLANKHSNPKRLHYINKNNNNQIIDNDSNNNDKDSNSITIAIIIEVQATVWRFSLNSYLAKIP